MFVGVLSSQAQSAEAEKIPWHHTSYLAKDGAPSYVTSLAQTPDGWLWVASSTGLYRFDGVRFELFGAGVDQLLYTDISALRALPDGSLWAGYRYGGATLLRQGHVVRHYPAQKGGLNGTTWDFVRDPCGQLWAATARGLFLLKQDGFHAAPAALGAPPAVIRMQIDRNGGFWLRSPDSILLRAAGADSFKPVPGTWGWGGLAEAPDGGIWANDHMAGGAHLLLAPARGGAAQQWRPAPGPSGQMAFDRAGRMWNLRGDGVEMAGAGDVPSRQLSFQRGLSGETGTAILADREGNIWVGTNGGLDRFRENKLTQYPALSTQGEALPLAVGKNGEIWSELQVIDGPDVPPVVYDRATPTPTSFSTAEFVDRDGRLWMHTFDNLVRIERSGRGFTRTVIPPPDDEASKKAGVAPGPALGMDSDGGLWAVFHSSPYRLKDGKWTLNGGIDQLPKIGYTTMYTAPDGVLWVGTRKNLIFSLTGRTLRQFDEKDGISLGAVSQFFWDGKTLWAGGNNGLAFLAGGRFHKVVGHGGEPFQATSGIAQSDDGDLWLNSGSGVFRIPYKEHRQLLKDAGYRVQYATLNHEDGLRGAAPQFGGSRNIVFARGRIWVTTTVGVFWFDPKHPLHNRLAPPVAIRGLSANDQEYGATAGLTLPKGTSRIRIDYTALSLTMPDRMQFRYRLDGVDAEWQQVTNQRAAFYTGLGPGRYRFQVQASNNDGVWNDAGATLDFDIAPKLVQTWWFKAAIVALLLLMLWLAHRLRLLHATRQARAKFEERLDERERIARDLHDTLLQSVQGMVLVVNNAAQRLSSQAEKDDIERALVHADAAIQEGRDRVQALRLEDDPGELFDTLVQLGAQRLQGHGCEFVPTLVGKPRLLHPIVAEECSAIGREALANAFRHARATRVTLEVAYGAAGLRIAIRDNGCGIPADVLAAGGRERHWGLKGMKERAAKIQAALDCRSSADGGTHWQLSLPARLAYADHAGDSRWRRFLFG
ncbi:sensor histidine kinase [Duganella callida]|nr:sensor histidine kinase [Duganella callida]